LLDVGTVGVGADELVLRVVSSAAKAFRVEKVSFSRSSVAGVTMWLEAQSPPLIQRRGHVFSLTTYLAQWWTLYDFMQRLCAHIKVERFL
jgi:hypothetical protein